MCTCFRCRLLIWRVLTVRRRLFLVQIAYVVEEVLLRDACVIPRKFGEAVRVVLSEHALYPYVYRESLHAVHTEQKHALRYLGSYALYRFQSRSCLVYWGCGYFSKVCFACINAVCPVAEVLRAEAAPQISERVGSLLRELLRRREISAVVVAETVDNAFDTGNIVVLGNNERDEVLSAVLPQKSYAARKFARL